jgi:hypothetical protein
MVCADRTFELIQQQDRRDFRRIGQAQQLIADACSPLKQTGIEEAIMESDVETTALVATRNGPGGEPQRLAGPLVLRKPFARRAQRIALPQQRWSRGNKSALLVEASAALMSRWTSRVSIMSNAASRPNPIPGAPWHHAMQNIGPCEGLVAARR